jgi:hypothetical protein
VVVGGTCIEPAQMTAIINSAGQVVGIDVVDPGLGYSETATITLEGGNGTGALAVAIMGNNLVRSIRTTIKYDRCEYESTIVPWQANVVYINGALVRYLNRVWQANSQTSSSVTGPLFDPTQWVLVDASTLSAADRTMGYYTPTVNMPGLSLPLLIDGIDYPGVQVQGVDFNQNTGYDVGNYDINPWDNIAISPEGFPTYDPAILDTIYQSYYPRPPEFPLPVPTGLGATDLNIEGGGYVDVYSSHAPEELVPGAVFDTLDFRVYTRPGSDWEVNGHGFPLVAITYTIDDPTPTLSFAGSVAVPVTVTVINQTLGILLDPQVDYTVDWINQSVTVAQEVSVGQTVVIDVYGLGGGNQLLQATYAGNDVGNELIVDVDYSQIQEFAIFVNGTLTTDYTYAQLYAEPGTTTFYISAGSAGTTLKVVSTLGISVGSLIVGTGFSSGQTVITKFDDTTLIISAAPNTTPAGDLTFKPYTGQTEITFGTTYTSTDLLSVTAIGPTLINGVSVNYSWSTAQVQTIVSPGSLLTFPLTNSLEYTNPDNLIVTVNGIRARTSAGAEWYGDGSTAYLLPTRLGFTQDLIADADVTVYVDNILQTQGADYSVEPFSPGDDRAVEFVVEPAIGSQILICVKTASQCYVNGSLLIFDPAQGLVPVTDSVIQIITWNDTRQQNILTQVYVGPITAGITVQEPYDSTNYDVGNVTGAAGSYDYTAGVIVTVNDLQLERPVANLDRLWVTLNGQRLSPEVDFNVVGQELVLTSGILQATDVVMISEFTDSTVPPAASFRIFQDMRGIQTTYRITASTTTALAQALSADADIIYVADASALSLPTLNNNNQWGALTINGERIMYRQRDLVANTVSGLIRGTAGTAATDHLVGSAVYNISQVNRLPTEYQNSIVSNLTNDIDLYPILGNGTNTTFVAEFIDASVADSTFDNESIEVYLGGIRQYAGYTITNENPATVEFDVAPPAGIQVTILVRRGVWWYNIATPAEREQSLQESANSAARFLRGQ